MVERIKTTWRPPRELWESLSEEAEKDGISLNAWMNMKLKKFKEKK